MRWDPFRRRNRIAGDVAGLAPQTALTASAPETASMVSAMQPSPLPVPIARNATPAGGRSEPTHSAVFDYFDDPDTDIHPPRHRRIDDVEVIDLSDEGRLGVVGESHYQSALHIAPGGRAAGDDFAEHIPATALLVPEPGNPFDRNAVRIDVLHEGRSLTVGYLTRGIAPDYQPGLMRLKKDGRLGSCPARIAGGGPDKYYGIYLHVAPPEFLLAPKRFGADLSFARIRDESILFNADRTCTVTREEDHQDVLSRHYVDYRDIERPGEFVLGFCDATKGRYQGERVVEVRIGVDRVGALTMAMSNRYAKLVEAAQGRGATALAHGHIDREVQGGYQVTLHMPSDPSRPRWYDG